MKMRKYIGSVLGVCALTMFAGCYEPLDITDTEMDMVAEYAAGVLVKHGTQTKEALLTPEEQEEEWARLATPTPRPTLASTAPPEEKDPSGSGGTSDVTSTPKPVATAVPDNTELTMQDLTELIGKDEFFFRYVGCTTAGIYEGKGGLFAAAGEGKKLVVLEFEITNQSATGATLSMNKGATKEYIYTLLADGRMIRPSLTLLEEDFYTSYTGTYKAGETKTGVLVFECDEKLSVDNATLTIVRDVNGMEDSVLIKVK